MYIVLNSSSQYYLSSCSKASAPNRCATVENIPWCTNIANTTVYTLNTTGQWAVPCWCHWTMTNFFQEPTLVDKLWGHRATKAKCQGGDGGNSNCSSMAGSVPGMVWGVPFPSVAKSSEGSGAGFHLVKMIPCPERSPTRPAVTRGTGHTSQAYLVSALWNSTEGNKQIQLS